MTKAKVLDTFTVEGVSIRTQLRTKNDWKSSYVWNGYVVVKGYRGTYKGKQVYYTDFLPEGCVRHHETYNDSDVDGGIVFTSQDRHLDIHRDPINGQNGGSING